MKLLTAGPAPGNKSTALIVVDRQPEVFDLPKYGSAEYFRWMRIYYKLKTYLDRAADLRAYYSQGSIGL